MTFGRHTVQTRRPLTSNLCPTVRSPRFAEWRHFVRYNCQLRPFLTIPTVGVIIGDVISRLYPVHAPTQSAKRAALAELGAALDQWYAELPDHLVFDPASSRSVPPPSVLLMHASYWNTVLLLHRYL
jgi:hypothetical protein